MGGITSQIKKPSYKAVQSLQICCIFHLTYMMRYTIVELRDAVVIGWTGKSAPLVSNMSGRHVKAKVMNSLSLIPRPIGAYRRNHYSRTSHPIMMGIG